MLLLVDYSSLLYRSFHATPATVPMNGVHGMLSGLARLLKDRRPDRLALATDADWRPEFRVQALPMYKAQRVSDVPDPVTPQEQFGRTLLRAMGLAVVGCDGYEGEDIVATLAARATERVEIYSGDRDLFALVRDPDVTVLYPGKGTLHLVTEGWVTEKYGIPGRAYLDFALLRGDPSDGLPGVSGIGAKTAASLLARYGSLEAILQATDLAPALRQKLMAGMDYLVAASEVVPPVRDVPLEPVSLDFPDTEPEPDVLEEAAQRYRLGGALGRLRAALKDRRANA